MSDKVGELEQLRATVGQLLDEQQADLEKLARCSVTIAAREKSVVEIWEEWRDLLEKYAEVKARLATGAQAAQQLERERNEARQLAIDFKACFEAAHKRIAELESQNDALQEKYDDLSERIVSSITRRNAVVDFLGLGG
jgi:chromosome segregation ATPase